MTDYDVNQRESIGPWDSQGGFQYSDRGWAAGVSDDVDMDFLKDSMLIHSQTSQPELSPGSIGVLLICRAQDDDILWGVSRGFSTTVGRPAAPSRISNPNVICKGQIPEIPDILRA